LSPETSSTESARLGLNDLSLLGVVLFWGLNMPLVKIAFLEINPDGFNGVRFSAAVAILLVLVRWTEGPVNLSRSEYLRMLGLGLVGHTAYQMLFIHGISRTTASHAALIFGVTPVIVAILSSLLGHEKIAPMGWAGALFAFGGVYLIISGHPLAVGPAPTVSGDLMILGATICWCIYTVLARPMLAKHSPLKVTAIAMAWGALFLVPFTLPGVIRQDWAAVTGRGWSLMAYACIFPLVIAYILWYRSVKQVGSMRTSIYSNLVPVIGTLAAWYMLDEALYLSMGIGAMAIFGGIALTRLWGIRSSSRQASGPAGGTEVARPR
jgi:drug/metabolite transporter (DMT)-like permease